MRDGMHAELARSPRFIRIAQVLRDEFGRLYGIATEQVDADESFIALGADSLMLLRASRFVRDQFGVRVPFRELLDGLGTVHRLAAHVHRELPVEEAAPPADVAPSAPAHVQPSPAPAVHLADAPSASVAHGTVERIVAQQLRVMQEQLDALAGRGSARSEAQPAPELASAVAARPATASVDRPAAAHEPMPAESRDSDTAVDGSTLTGPQSACVVALVERLTAMTGGSRQIALAARVSLADPASVVGPHAEWSAVDHPLAVEQAAGGTFTDVDGNRFVDLEMRGGDAVLGHAFPGVVDAMRAALESPSPRAAAEAAELLCDATGAERAAFFAGRVEATAAALRIVRTVTERDTVAVFADADHAPTDALLARGTPLGDGRAVPAIPGVPAATVGTTLVLDAGDAGLETLRARGFGIAAVLVDASRIPAGDADAVDFLRALARICVDTGAALVLDECTTLPRLHPGGVARIHDISPDLAIIGPALGNGAPVAALVGRASYLEVVDGGAWNPDDTSHLRIETTRVRGDEPHAVGIAAAGAVLRHVREHGAEATARMGRQAHALAAAFRDALGDAGPLSFEIHGSRAELHAADGAQVDADLLRLHLRARGVHVPASGAWHLCAAHTDADVAHVAAALRSAAAEMRAAGFLASAAATDVDGDADATIDLPLTAGQREIWLASQLSDEGERAYHEATALRIRGPFSPAAMEAALRTLVARHQALRTRFGALGQAQHVEPRVTLDVPLTDLSALPAAEAEAELAAVLAEEAARPFDLAIAPLFRARIVRLGDADHVLAYTLHHAVTDGWSNGVLLAELQELYAAEVAGRPYTLPAPASYADVVRRRATGSEESALAFWRDRLSGALPVLELPADRARPAEQSFAGGLERQELDPALRARLDALCESRGTTLYAVLLAAFQLFLHRLTGQDDVLVGTIAAGQAWDEDAAAVGCFVDLLPIRSTLHGDAGFSAFAAGAHEALFAALDHRGVPLGRLLEALDVARDPSRPPLVSATFNWNRADGEGARFGAATTERIETHGGTAKFDLSVTAVEAGAGTWLEWEYASDLFDAATVRRWMGHFQTLLAAAVDDAERPVRALPLLTPTERTRALDEWNAAAPGDNADACLHTPFERQAAATPHAVALETADERVTYAELDARANRVAAALRRLGVTADTVVGLSAERSVQMVVGMIGILKAGGAYLPLDPALPADRLVYMAADARPAAVLATAGARPALPPLDAPVLLLADAESASGETEDGRFSCPAGPANLAYVIYTSGSTGRPKGVMVPHRGIRNRVAWVRDTYPMDASDAVLFKTPYTFDASVWELFLPLWTGGRVVIARPGGHQEPAYMVETMAHHGVTTLQLVPSMLQVVAGTPRLERCTALRRLSCGGEAFPVALAREVSARLPGAAVINLYGPTEASIDVLSWRYDGSETGTLLPIGRPVHGTRVYLLDGDLQPVAPGAPGELYADGPGLARGYVGRPGLTAEKFIPDPYSPVPGGRMYRTGDLARHRADGAVEFLGRADDQVKLRGFRIELGEVESVLAAHPTVEAAVAAVRTVASGPALVAYVVGAGGSPDPAELREHARRHLPDYMVPAAVLVLDALPRTPGGKVDRLALPTPRAADLASRDGYVPPRSAAEQVLADVWSEVLRCGAVGVHDRFFDLGGHSLTALQLLARVRSVLGVEVPLRALFDAPTVAGLAAAVERVQGESADADVPPLVRYPAEGESPLSFAQQRLWLLHHLEPESPAYNLYTAVPLPARADLAAAEAALAGLVARHESLRTTLPEGEGGGAQRVHPAGPVPVAVLDFAGDVDGTERARAALRDEVLRPFDLAAGPLLRATLVRVDGSGDQLVLVMHHAVSDGWSLDVIRDEVTALYAASVEDRPSPLPELAVQYGDYARWEREWLRGPALERQLAFWRTRLAGMPQVIELPADRPRPAAQSYRGGNAVLALPADVADALRALGREASATLFMTLLGAWKTLLHRWGAGDDLVVGTHVANRDRVEVERLVGFFVNSLVLRTDLSGDPTFREVLGRVRETALGAFSHAHLPFDRLVEELQPRRDMGVPPLYQVSFDLQRVAGVVDDGAPRLLEESPTTKFDLEVTALETDDGVQVHVAYATDLFDAATIARMLGHLDTLVRAAAADPDRRISALPLLGAEEHALLTRDFQGPRRAYRTDRTLDQLFAEQAARTPSDVAVVCAGRQATYAEMDAQSNRIARTLREMGVGRGQRVGVLMERGIGFIAAVLGALKAGAAYVPMDPAYPAHRLAHMLGDSGIGVLLTRAEIAAGHQSALTSAARLRAVVCTGSEASVDPGDSVDPTASVDEADAVRALREAAPGLRVIAGAEVDAMRADALDDGAMTHPRDPAYVLYTSGSTGLPKGAVVRHDGAVNHVFAECEVLGLGAELRFLQSAPASSDISVWQMLAPLLVGGRSVVVDADTVSEPDRLLAVLRGEGITLFEPVPAVLRGLLDHATSLPSHEAALPALRCVMATGEEVPVDLVNGWLRAYPQTVVVNAYGPTEASDDVTQTAIAAPLPDDARGVSIGRPLPNLDCHVVDAWMGLVPIGVPGELCIGGIAVGDGYVGQPARTAAAFVPDPFGPAGGILYRTGDRVRWTADGELEFLGRIDRQVKVRGFRIEPGEIETALRIHPAVRDCAVVVRAEGESRTLVAYLAADEAGAPDAGALRDHLRERVPEHMVPTLFVRVDALPLTPAGKVDRRALADDRRQGMAPAAAHVAPRTPTEQVLAEIWGTVLGRAQVGVEDDFFELGGHSLLAAMVAARIRQALHVTLPLRRVFEHTTVAALAAHVDAVRGEAARPAGPTLSRVARTGRRVAAVDDGIIKRV